MRDGLADVAMTVIGSYAYTGNMAGPATMLVFALLGWAMRRYDYPVAATVIGLLLGSMIEGELVRSMQISGGELAYFLGRPAALLLALFIVISLFGDPIRRRLRTAGGLSGLFRTKG